MFKSYLKIALRHVLKYKTYSFINVFGLAVGVACCILVFLFVQHEMSYDKFHEHADRLYRVNLLTKTPAGSMKTGGGQPLPLAPTLKAAFPEIRFATRFAQSNAVVRTSPENATKEQVLFTDGDFFKMFSFPLLHGSAETVLEDKKSIVLSEAMAQKYFGNETPLGQTLTLNFGGGDEDFTVAGVARKIPSHSSITFDFLLRYENAPNYRDLEASWTSWGAVTFMQLAENVRPAELQAKFRDFEKNYYQAMINTWQILGWIAKEEGALQLSLQPLTEIHLTPEVENGLFPASNPAYSFILSGVGLIVLLIACINFTTLAIGRAAGRTMEVGMRKTMGATRGRLLRQFWGEGLLFSLLALLMGIALAEFFLPTFNSLANKTLAIHYPGNWQIYGVFVGVVLFVAFVAGGYPAVFLSGFQPIAILKNRLALGSKHRLSQALVVVQFSLSVLLIICAMIMSGQLRHLKTQNPGFNEEQIVVIPTNARGEEGEQMLERYRQRLRGYSSIAGVTGNSDGFNKEPSWQSFGTKDGANWQVNIMRVDKDFVKTMGMEIVQGRDFSPEMTSDVTEAVIVNQTLVAAFGWKDPARSGQKFSDFSLGKWNDPIMKEPAVIGVVRDFNYTSLHEKVKPLVLYLAPENAIKYIFVRLTPGDFAGALELLRNAWREAAPGKPFDYYFLDEDFDRQYRAEERWAQIVSYATLFAVIIACVGLFGLSALAVTKRTKEIGIRKVLGASVAGIVSLLAGDFLKLVAFANIIAWPIAWYAMKQWLQNFAYRIDIGWWMFALAGGLALLIAFFTVSAQAIKAALANPVESLRYE
jgi:putative ABC transport system permease protein